MNHTIITCESLIKKITRTDTLFNGQYCIDPYQNCEIGCLYCDSSFDHTIYIKHNAAEILEKELPNLQKGVIIIGSVHDPYQKAELKYELTKKILQSIKKHQFPCHILTKSTHILRDINLLTQIDCTVTISISSTDEKVAKIFEQNVPSPLNRLQTIKTLTDHNIKTGLALIPILPYITETSLEDIVQQAKNHNARYILHKHLELKGEQKQQFISIITKSYPDLKSAYTTMYKNRILPDEKHISLIEKKLQHYCKQYHIPNKIN